jgi:hypothetical protein
MEMTSSTSISNSPAISTTRNLLKPNLRKSLRATGVEPDGSNAPRQPRVGNCNRRCLLTPNCGAQLFRGQYFEDHDALCLQQREHFLPTVPRRVMRHQRQTNRCFPHLGTHLLHADHDQPTAHAQTDQRSKLPPLRFIDQAALPPVAPVSSPPSSTVSSSRMPMIRSASAGAMPGSLRKSARSRSIISLSVR